MLADEAERHKQRNKRWWDERVAVSHMIPGYRSLYKQNGITKLQVQIGRTKDHRLTPEQEHKERTDGEREKRIRNTLELNEGTMKELMNWMWKTRYDKPGDEDKKWAPAAEIPRQIRPKLNQLSQFDWQNLNPYPGWMLAVEQGCAGWKCKLMNEDEFNKFKESEKRRNPKSQRRIDLFAEALKMRKEKSVSSTSANKEPTKENSETDTTSDAESPSEINEEQNLRCLEELLLPMKEIDNTMLALWLEIKDLSATHTCDTEFLGMETTISAEIPRAVTPLRVEEKYSGKNHLSLFSLPPTKTQKKQWEETSKNLERLDLKSFLCWAWMVNMYHA